MPRPTLVDVIEVAHGWVIVVKVYGAPKKIYIRRELALDACVGDRGTMVPTTKMGFLRFISPREAGASGEA